MTTGIGIITEFLVRNNRTTTDSFITDSTLDMWLENAHQWAAAYHKWPFTESSGYLGTAGSETYAYSNKDEIKADSVRTLVVDNGGGASAYKRFQKTQFNEYLKYKEDYPAGTERIFTDYNRTIYINSVAGVSGSILAFYQARPAAITAASTTTVFTNWDDEGNEALVEKMTSYYKNREHLPDEAQLHDEKAKAVLEAVWQRVADEQAMYQSSPTSAGQFAYIDVLRGRARDDWFKRDQFGFN